MNRQELVWFNGNLMKACETDSGIFDAAIDYAGDIFDGVRTYESDGVRYFFRLKDHVLRGLKGARLYRLVVPFTANELIQAHLELAKAEPVYNYFRLRIWWGQPVKKDSTGRVYTIAGVDPRRCQVNVAVIADNWQEYLHPDVYTKGAGVIISPYARPFPNVGNTAAKGPGNYAVSQLAKMMATEHLFKRADGQIVPCSDAIMLTPNGFVSEMTGANLFIRNNSRVRTPLASDCVLPGITRDFILKAAGLKNSRIEVERITLMDLLTADEVLAVGSAAEVSPIVWVAGYQIGNSQPGKTFKTFRGYFEYYLKRAKQNPFGFFTAIE